jgi:iron(III) transport system ATP-binding protein
MMQVTGLHAGYGRARVLHGIDLDVGRGELVSVLGASGSGKTTLLRVVAGLHPAASGTVSLDGRDVTRLRPEKRRIGLVPQEGALFGHLDVARNVEYGARGRAAELLELVGLAGYEKRMPHELSGGQRQRVALARALAPSPAAVLLDEPFAGLDAALRSEVRADVARVLRECGATAVLITHDQDEALSVSDRVAVLHEGRLAQTATPRELYRSPATAWVAGFVGEAALLPGTSDGRCVRTALGDLPVRSGPSGEVLAVIRPEDLRLGGGVSATVRSADYLGHTVLVRFVLVDGTPLTARLPEVPGGEVTVGIAAPVHTVPHP